jgi:hypothetical protein
VSTPFDSILTGHPKMLDATNMLNNMLTASSRINNVGSTGVFRCVSYDV